MKTYTVNIAYRFPGLSVGDEFEAEPNDNLSREVAAGYLLDDESRAALIAAKKETSDGTQTES